MTAAANAPDTTGDAVAGRRPGRVAGAPFWWHVVALAAVLLVGLWLTAPLVAFSSDEGAAVVQAQMLRDGHGWHYHSPIRSIDPEDQARPFVRGDHGNLGVAPLAKHPLYPVILAGADLVGGTVGMILLGMAGTLVAAVLAARLVGRLDESLARPVLWLVGLASPLFFDAYLVQAHTLAAAAVAGAALAAVATLRRHRRRSHRLVSLAAMTALLWVGAMLRTEALLVGPALALAAAVIALARRTPKVRAGFVAVAAVAGSALAWLTDRVWSRTIIGSPRPTPANASPSTWLGARWEALHTTWFQATYSGNQAVDTLLGLGALALLVAALLAHWRRARPAWVAVPLVLAVSCYVLRLVAASPEAAPGLAIAFPAGWFLLWASGRRALREASAPLLALTSAAAVGGVLLTEYAIGGGVEWGGRYFAVIIPVAVPVITFAAVPVIRRHGADLARLVVVSLAVVSLASSWVALGALRSSHQHTAAVLDAIAREAQRSGTSGGFDAPVVISSNRLLPQLDSRDFSRYVWVVPSQDELRRYADRLAERGVRRAVLVSDDQKADLSQLPGWRVQQSVPGLALDVSVLEYTGSS